MSKHAPLPRVLYADGRQPAWRDAEDDASDDWTGPLPADVIAAIGLDPLAPDDGPPVRKSVGLRMTLHKALSKELQERVTDGSAHWVTVKEGPLEGRHLLIEGPRPAAGHASQGKILAGHGIPPHVVEKITGATHAEHVEHKASDGPVAHGKNEKAQREKAPAPPPTISAQDMPKGARQRGWAIIHQPTTDQGIVRIKVRHAADSIWGPKAEIRAHLVRETRRPPRANEPVWSVVVSKTDGSTGNRTERFIAGGVTKPEALAAAESYVTGASPAPPVRKSLAPPRAAARNPRGVFIPRRGAAHRVGWQPNPRARGPGVRRRPRGSAMPGEAGRPLAGPQAESSAQVMHAITQSRAAVARRRNLPGGTARGPRPVGTPSAIVVKSDPAIRDAVAAYRAALGQSAVATAWQRTAQRYPWIQATDSVRGRQFWAAVRRADLPVPRAFWDTDTAISQPAPDGGPVFRGGGVAAGGSHIFTDTGSGGAGR